MLLVGDLISCMYLYSCLMFELCIQDFPSGRPDVNDISWYHLSTGIQINKRITWRPAGLAKIFTISQLL